MIFSYLDLQVFVALLLVLFALRARWISRGRGGPVGFGVSSSGYEGSKP